MRDHKSLKTLSRYHWVSPRRDVLKRHLLLQPCRLLQWMWNPLHPMSVECVGRIIALTGVLNYYIVMGLNTGRECRGQAYVIGACVRDIMAKAVHLCAQNVMVDITSCYVGSNLFQRGLLPMWRVSLNLCQWQARKFPELSSSCQV